MPETEPPPLPATPAEADARTDTSTMAETDDGPVKGKSASAVPNRLCIATRVVHPIHALIRFVREPEGGLVPDIRNKLPGRGCWVHADRASLALAIKRKAFSRALKSELRIPDDLVEMVETLLVRDALQSLSLANKAGAVVSGFAKIEAARGTILALVQAQDGSGPEIARLQGLCQARGRNGQAPERIRTFDAAQLALSLGYEHVIHAAIMDKDAGLSFLTRALRVVHFQASNPAEQSPVS